MSAVLPLFAAAHSALDPAGPQAGRIASLFWTMVGTFTLVYAAVLFVLAAAVLRRRADAGPTDARLAVVVGSAIAVTTLVLFGFLVASVSAGRALSSLETGDDGSISVVGQQWWWELEYNSPAPDRRFTTANELHIPVGRPVKLHLRARDVIHSFWVPSLHGKTDLIPGQINTTVLQADRPGVYRGQCAEFCGYQHAHMAFAVVADDPSTYEAWVAHQRTPAEPPNDARTRRGQAVFLATTCATCHTISGTEAMGRNGPDLTHLASRSTLAAGTLPFTPDHLRRWITDPQSVKPGTKMPAARLDADDLDALVAYLGGLR
jgi:cytochrome c oxidase subunit 2